MTLKIGFENICDNLEEGIFIVVSNVSRIK